MVIFYSYVKFPEGISSLGTTSLPVEHLHFLIEFHVRNLRALEPWSLGSCRLWFWAKRIEVVNSIHWVIHHMRTLVLEYESQHLPVYKKITQLCRFFI